MPQALMTTKLRAPRTRPNLVARPREVLSRAERRRLTLVSAPAGFGKTTLLGEWSEDLRRRYPLLEDMRGIKPVPVRRFPPSSRALGPREFEALVGACLSERIVAGARDAAVVVAAYVGGVFALFAALGLRFSPRIRHVADQRLWRLDGAENAGFFGGLHRGKIDENLVLRHWDDILRAAGSLKMGWVTSSLLISRLQARPRKNALTRALQEYGRLEKTILLLRYAESEDLRRRIGRQLNKGEELHALRRFLFFANEGHVRKRQPEEQTEQALRLNLLTDAVILWNTVRYQEALDGLRSDGYLVRDEDLAHPLRPRKPLRPLPLRPRRRPRRGAQLGTGRSRTPPAGDVLTRDRGRRAGDRRLCVKKK